MISVIIPTRGLKRKKNLRSFHKKVTSLPDLIKSLKINLKMKYEVIVVINDNADEVKSFLQENKIEKYCINSLNVGVSRAWNIGRELAEGDYLFYLNDDVTIGEDSVEKLVEYLQVNKDTGMIGPKGAKWQNGKHHKFVGELSIEEADAISGFSFMTPSHIFDKVGGFDINYTPAGYEEIDYAFKVRSKGFKCIVMPSLNIYTEPAHGISAQNTTIKYLTSSINTLDLNERNKKYFMKKWIST